MSKDYENDMGMEKKDQEEAAGFSGRASGDEAGLEQDNMGNQSYGNNTYGNDTYGNNTYGNNSYGSASYGTTDNAPNTYGGNPYNQSGQPYPGYYAAGNQKNKDGIAFGVASLVLGIVTVVLFCSCISWITGILAIIFGIVQLVKYNKKGLAIGGIITGAIGLLLTILLYAMVFLNFDSSYRYNDIHDIIYDNIYDEIYDELYEGYHDGI